MTVAAVGVNGQQFVAFGALDNPQTFEAGQTLMRQIVLRGSGTVSITDTGCIVWQPPGRREVILPDDDQDCDNCSTTEEFPTENCPPKPGDGDHKKALALLHQQLQDALSAG